MGIRRITMILAILVLILISQVTPIIKAEEASQVTTITDVIYMGGLQKKLVKTSFTISQPVTLKWDFTIVDPFQPGRVALFRPASFSIEGLFTTSTPTGSCNLPAGTYQLIADPGLLVNVDQNTGVSTSFVGSAEGKVEFSQTVDGVVYSINNMNANTLKYRHTHICIYLPQDGDRKPDPVYNITPTEDMQIVWALSKYVGPNDPPKPQPYPVRIWFECNYYDPDHFADIVSPSLTAQIYDKDGNIVSTQQVTGNYFDVPANTYAKFDFDTGARYGTEIGNNHEYQGGLQCRIKFAYKLDKASPDTPGPVKVSLNQKNGVYYSKLSDINVDCPYPFVKDNGIIYRGYEEISGFDHYEVLVYEKNTGNYIFTQEINGDNDDDKHLGTIKLPAANIDYLLRVVAYDKGGNRSAESQPITVRWANGKPETPVVVNEFGEDHKITNQSIITWRWNAVDDLSGLGIKEYQVLLKKDDIKVLSQVVNTTEYTYNVPKGQDGEYSLQVTAVNLAELVGNSSNESVVIVDRVGPQASFADYPVLVRGSKLIITWKQASDISNIDHYEVAITSTQTEPQQGTAVKGSCSCDTLSFVWEKANYVWIRAVDGLNNIGSWVSYGPFPNFTFTPNSDIPFNNKTLQTFEVASSIGKRLQARVGYRKKDDSADVLGSWTLDKASILFPEGETEWWIEVCEMDANGNLISASHQSTPRYKALIDRTPPTGSLTVRNDDNSKVVDEGDNPTNSKQVRLIVSNLNDGTVNSSGVRGIYVWNGESTERPASGYLFIAMKDINTTSGIPWILDLDNGTRTIMVQIEDNAGNTTLLNYKVKIDQIFPGKPANFSHSFSTDNQRLIFNWDVSNTQDLKSFTGSCLLPDGTTVQFGNITPTLIGNGSYQGTVEIPSATYGPNKKLTLTIHAIDKAGNDTVADSYTAYTKAALPQVKNVSGGYNQNDKYYLQWELTGSPDNADSYILEFKSDQGFMAMGSVGANGDSSIKVTGLQAHGQYYYRLVALNLSGDRTEGTVSGEPCEVPNNLPIAATLNSPVDYANEKVNFIFTQPSHDVDGDMITYRIYISRDDRQYVLYSPSTFPLANGKTYFWYVEADDGHTGRVKSEKSSFMFDNVCPQISTAISAGAVTNLSEVKVTVADVKDDENKNASGISKVVAEKSLIDSTVPYETIEVKLSRDNDEFSGCIPLEEGNYNLKVTVYDKAGNASSTNLNKLLVDRTNPVLSNVKTGLALKNGRYVIRDNQINLNFRAEDPGEIHAGVKKLLCGFVANSSEVVKSANEYSLAKESNDYQYPLNATKKDGESFYLAVALADCAGNISAYQYIGPILIDSCPPTLKLDLTGLGPNGYVSNLTNLKCTVITNDPYTTPTAPEFAWLIKDQTKDEYKQLNNWGTLQTLLEFNLSPGKYKIVCRSFNEAGIEGRSESSPFVFDNTAPTNVNLATPTYALVSGERAIFKVSAKDPDSVITQFRLRIGSTQGGCELTKLIDGNQDGWVTINSIKGSEEISIIIPDVSNGTYYCTLEAVNAAGLAGVYRDGLISVDNNQQRVVVSDQGPYTMFDNTFSASWKYIGENTIQEYRYQVLDSDMRIIKDWETTKETEVIVNNLKLDNGKKYYFKVMAVCTDGNSVEGLSPGVTVDTSPPVKDSLTVPPYTTSTNLRLSWIGHDDVSGISRIQVAIGSNYWQTDVSGGWIETAENDVCLANKTNGSPLALVSGEKYYITLRLTDGAGNVSELIAPVVTIDDTNPPIPIVTDQGSYINMEQDLKGNWVWSDPDPESGTIYQWAILDNTNDPSSAIWHNGDDTMRVVLSPSIYTRTDGHTYYFAVKATNGAGKTSIGLSDGIKVDATAPIIPDVVLKQAVNFGSGKKEVNYISNLVNLELSIDSFDLESGITRYEYAYGTANTVENAPKQSSTDPIIPLQQPNILENKIYIFKGECYNGAELKSQPGYSIGVKLDTGTPKITNVRGGFTQDKLIFNWNVKNSGSPVAWYEVALVPENKINEPPANWTNVRLNQSYSIDAVNLTDGKYYLLIRACNEAGSYSKHDDGVDNWGVSPCVVVDKTPPVLKGNSFKYPQYANKQIKDVYIEASDELSGIYGYQYALGDLNNPFKHTSGWVDIENSSGSLSFNIPTDEILDRSKVYLMIRVKDKAGNWSKTLVSKIIFIDRTPPTQPVVTCGSYTHSKYEITDIHFSSQDDESGVNHYQLGIVVGDGTEWIVTREGLVSEFNNTISELNLTDCETYRIAVKTQNGADDWSEIGYSQPIKVDAVPPSITFDKQDATIVLNTPPVEIGFSLSKPATVEFVLTAKEAGTAITKTVQCQAGANRYTLDQAQPGIYQLTAKPTDAAGNIGDIKTQIIRINKPPVLSLNELLNSHGVLETTPGAPLKLSAVVYDPDGEPGDTFTYLWNTGVSGEAACTEATPDYKYQKIGDYTLTLTVTDKDGGVATASIEVHVGNTTQGTLYMDEIWSGVHYICGNITVPAEIKLTIKPGTEIKVKGDTQTGYNHQLLIKGSLIIEDSGVNFSCADDKSNTWQGIYIEGHADISGLTIKDATRGITVVDTADVSIRNSVFRFNEVGLHVIGSKPLVDACSFLENRLYGIKEDDGGKPAVTNCQFDGNGIHYYDDELSDITISELNKAGNHDNRFLDATSN